ncbi:hypothetical protein M527_02420 [Sphingobium indicum IP26]|uniref:hypothetical protein n=1 Tax=Sphingobium TaxID=165695 RepID=UPI0003750A3F|nr:hypothetical protein [Sphingobium sp. PNB]EPR11569.1 hypothetical protein M527_02420 [Sphingobium indicum IP26]MCB4863017.1 hypothetical protein [Sphingobium sp. PNB]
MSAIGRMFGWLGRKAILYIIILAAMLTYVIWRSGDIQDAWSESQSLNLNQAHSLKEVSKGAERLRLALSAELTEAGRVAQIASVAQLEDQVTATRAELQRLQMEAPAGLDRMLDKVSLDIQAIRKEQERLLNVAFLERKLAGLEQALGAAKDYDAAIKAAADGARRTDDMIRKKRIASDRMVQKYQRAWNDAKAACQRATNALAAFDRSWFAKTLDRLPLQDRRAELVDKKNRECTAERNAHQAVAKALAAKKIWDQMRAGATQAAPRAKAWIDNELPGTAKSIMDEISDQEQLAGQTVTAWGKWVWTEYEVGAILKAALAALFLILAVPYLVRLFCWFVLAPIAMRRPSIRIRVPEDRGIAIAPAALSSTSVAVRLAQGEELLVRQDYLQTSSYAGAKDTKWVLNWKKPVTSVATGLTFLTRIRGDCEITTISATRDGLAEVTILTLPDGACCVLQPRALAAVTQPISRPLRITRHWRLRSLNAWLTLQLRYLVFHGPARLVLKGGRGVRVERAEQGRVFGQDQLVGFSADLAYSVSRTETFWPYFFGRQQLLKDRVLAGKGVLIVEEAPFTARRGKVRRGLEGMIDAGMKVFGM